MGQFEEEFTRWEFWSNWALFGQFHSSGVRMWQAHMKHLDKQGQMRCVHIQVTNVTNRCPWPVDPDEGRLQNESQKPICVCVHAPFPPPVSSRPNQTQGCISCVTCSYPELTEDHVLTSAYVKIFRTVTRNAVNKGVWRKKNCSWRTLNKYAIYV